MSEQDAAHLGRGALEGSEAQQQWDDGLAERLCQGQVLDAVVRLQVLGGDAAQHDRRQTHAALDLPLQRVGGGVHLWERRVQEWKQGQWWFSPGKPYQGESTSVTTTDIYVYMCVFVSLKLETNVNIQIGFVSKFAALCFCSSKQI